MRNVIDLMHIYVSTHMFVCWMLLYAHIRCMYRYARVYIISVCVCQAQVSQFLPKME